MPNNPALRPRTYGTVDVALILCVDDWRIKNFVQGKSYRIWEDEERNEKPKKRGRGKERHFTFDNLMRIAVANALCVAGFTPEVTGAALQKVKHREIKRWVDLYTVGGHPKPLCLVEASGNWKVLDSEELQTAFAAACEEDKGFFSLNLTSLWDGTVRRITDLEAEGLI